MGNCGRRWRALRASSREEPDMALLIFEDVARTGSRLEKEAGLTRCREEEKKLLKYAYDPSITYGVTVDEEELVAHAYESFVHRRAPMTREVWWERFFVMLDALAARSVTGTAAVDRIADVMSFAPDEADARWAARVINRDLRAGFSISTINNVFPGLIDEFLVQLAQPYDPERHELDGPWVAEEKLDGLRMATVEETPFTRNGKLITSAARILDDMDDILAGNVFDGENMGGGDAGDFDEASGQIRRKDGTTAEDAVYHVFDVVPIDQWRMRSTIPHNERNEMLRELLGRRRRKHVVYVPHIDIGTNPPTAELTRLRDYMISKGFEGLILKRDDMPYQFKRSRYLLKYKDMMDADGRIVGYYEGKGKYKGMLGGFSIMVDGVPTNFGSGYSDQQRKQFWHDRDDMVGLTAEVQYQNKTKKNAKCRFPVFLKMRPDKD
jgi:DNA ligase 1